MGKARTQVVRMAFNNGEFAPRLDARVDLEKAALAARTLENMTVYVHGGARRRPGLRFVVEIPSE